MNHLTGSVLLLGGAGFLCRAILRRAEREGWPATFTVLSRDESKHLKVAQRYPNVRIVRGDVTAQVPYLTALFAGHDTVIHAAANKMVDAGEFAAFETVNNNVIGTANVALACMAARVQTAIFVSSDKAVQPINSYGMSKALGERLWQEAASLGGPRFVATRYGNVVGSTASVVVEMQRQLRQDGYIRVTNPDMTRFYMGADEAIDAVLYAANEAENGSVAIPKMRAMMLADLARLALGRKPEDLLVDARVRVLGPRPGEKVHESLLHEQESVRIINPDAESTYYELRPVGKAYHDQPFAISSDKPPLGWMPYPTMAGLIQDSEDV